MKPLSFQAHNELEELFGLPGGAPPQAERLDFEVRLTGKSVLSALQREANNDDSKKSFVAKPVKPWMQKVANKGRNVIELKRRKREVAPDDDDDQRSIAASEVSRITVVHRRREN